MLLQAWGLRDVSFGTVEGGGFMPKQGEARAGARRSKCFRVLSVGAGGCWRVWLSLRRHCLYGARSGPTALPGPASLRHRAARAAAVDDERRAGHVVGGVRRQEEDRPRDVLGLGEAAEGDALEDVVKLLGGVLFHI